jgi:hypothetical protein
MISLKITKNVMHIIAARILGVIYITALFIYLACSIILILDKECFIKVLLGVLVFIPVMRMLCHDLPLFKQFWKNCYKEIL